MSDDQSFSAAPAMAGYMWQVRQALLFLLHAEPEQVVELESHEDVVISSLTGDILTALQGKHSFESGSLNYRSSELWKTIRVWASLAAKNRITSETPLLLCSTLAVGKELQCLAKKNKTKAELELLQKRLNSVANEKKNKELRPAFHSWLGLAQGRRFSLLRQTMVLEAQPRLSEIDAKLDLFVRRMGVPPNTISAVRKRLIGWFDSVVASRLELGGCKVTFQELEAELIELRQMQLPAVLMSTKGMAPYPALQAERKTDPVYLRQMDLLEAEEADLVNAVAMFHRAQAERNEWLQMHIAGRTALVNYDNDLKNRWGTARLEFMRVKPTSKKALLKAGWSIYSECMKYQGNYNGLAVPVHMVSGSYHMLANGPEEPPAVGWHPDYESRLVPLGRKK